MSLQRVLNANLDVSSEFRIEFCKQVTLVGTPRAAWTVERAEGYIDDGETRVWSIDESFAQTVTGGDVTGTLGYVYRINLGSGNGAAGLFGNVADMRLGGWN
jgi:hypothetical protein